jgi:hypothetical protein
VTDHPESSTATAPSQLDQSVTPPSAVARILATAVVATIIGASVTKLFGKNAGIVAVVVAATAHEMFDAPLARRLSNLGL